MVGWLLVRCDSTPNSILYGLLRYCHSQSLFRLFMIRRWAATGYSSCLLVYSESAHLAAVALHLCHGYPSHNKLLVLVVADLMLKLRCIAF